MCTLRARRGHCVRYHHSPIFPFSLRNTLFLKHVYLQFCFVGDSCYNYRTWGRCSRGLTCRFGGEHIEDGRNKIDRAKYDETLAAGPSTINHLSMDVQVALRKKTYDFEVAEGAIKAIKDDISIKTSGAVTDEDVVKVLSREKKTIDFRGKLFLSPLTTVGNLPFRRICKEFGADVTCGEMAMCSSLLQGMFWLLIFCLREFIFKEYHRSIFLIFEIY